MFVSEWVKKFSKSIVDNYNDWRQWDYEFYNKKTGLCIWTSNWYSFLRLSWQNESFWWYFEKRHIYKAILEAIRLQIEEKWYIEE